MPARSDSESNLREQLREKERTIATLQEHLERAASSLESARRSSATGGVAFPPEMVDQQRELADRLDRAVVEWEQLAAAQRIEQLAADMSDIREQVSRTLESLLGEDEPVPEPSSGEPPAESDDPARQRWEALKAEMLDGKTRENATTETDGADLAEDLDVLADRPEPLDSQTADHAAWLDAVDKRQKYVISLIRTLRAVEARRRGQVDWSTLTTAPEELRQRVAAREAEYLQKLRSGEVELSIERARLSRLENTLAQQAHESEKAARHADMAGQQEGQTAQGRRWMRFLGGGRNE